MPWAITQEENKPSPVSSYPQFLAALPYKMEWNGKSQNCFDVDADTMLFYFRDPASVCAWEGVSSSGLKHCLRTHCIRSLLPTWASTSFACRANC